LHIARTHKGHEDLQALREVAADPQEPVVRENVADGGDWEGRKSVSLTDRPMALENLRDLPQTAFVVEHAPEVEQDLRQARWSKLRSPSPHLVLDEEAQEVA
jgi:hypothetical protein